MAGFEVTANILKQKGYELYLFSMNSALLNKICYVTPRSHDDPDEVQRILNNKRAKEIGQYIQEETALLPNAIVVSLTTEVEITNTGNPHQKVLHFPSDDDKLAYVLDGQHRLAGFEYSEGTDFDLPVVALWNADDHLRGKIFADINSKQVKVTNVHLLSLYYQIRELPSEESSTMDVVIQLNDNRDSPLNGKIKMMDADRGCWVTNRHMKRCLAPHTESGGVLSRKPPAQQAVIFKEFFKGVQRVWPDAWGNTREYMLCRPMGIETILSMFTAAKHRCDLNDGRQYTADTFERQLQVLQDVTIELPGGGALTLTWERGPFGSLSNKAGKTWIRKQLLDQLRQADET
ncbi:MAG: DGQHR domain-containing protein [Chloroflexi bacterium]|nr:DGQHR domain-containing protein [Chloroflexota bacterium]